MGSRGGRGRVRGNPGCSQAALYFRWVLSAVFTSCPTFCDLLGLWHQGHGGKGEESKVRPISQKHPREGLPLQEVHSNHSSLSHESLRLLLSEPLIGPEKSAQRTPALDVDLMDSGKAVSERQQVISYISAPGLEPGRQSGELGACEKRPSLHLRASIIGR